MRKTGSYLLCGETRTFDKNLFSGVQAEAGEVLRKTWGYLQEHESGVIAQAIDCRVPARLHFWLRQKVVGLECLSTGFIRSISEHTCCIVLHRIALYCIREPAYLVRMKEVSQSNQLDEKSPRCRTQIASNFKRLKAGIGPDY